MCTLLLDHDVVRMTNRATSPRSHFPVAVGGYDNALLFNGWSAGQPPVARVSLYAPGTGIAIDMVTDQASVQVYSGNGLSGNIPRKAVQGPGYYQHWGAVTLEAQGYIGAVNQPGFPTSRLAAGDTYVQRTSYHIYVRA